MDTHSVAVSGGMAITHIDGHTMRCLPVDYHVDEDKDAVDLTHGEYWWATDFNHIKGYDAIIDVRSMDRRVEPGETERVDVCIPFEKVRGNTFDVYYKHSDAVNPPKNDSDGHWAVHSEK